MSRTPQIRVITGSPIGAAWAESDVADLTFVLEGGDHLHLQTSRAGLENLSRHIEHILSERPSPPDRGAGKAEHS